MHMLHKPILKSKNDHTDTEVFVTQFRPLSEIIAYDTHFVDSRYGRDNYWDDDSYDQDKLEYRNNHIKPNDQIESTDLNTDSHASDPLRYAIIDL